MRETLLSIYEYVFLHQISIQLPWICLDCGLLYTHNVLKDIESIYRSKERGYARTTTNPYHLGSCARSKDTQIGASCPLPPFY